MMQDSIVYFSTLFIDCKTSLNISLRITLLQHRELTLQWLLDELEDEFNRIEIWVAGRWKYHIYIMMQNHLFHYQRFVHCSVIQDEFDWKMLIAFFLEFFQCRIEKMRD
jgi:hypothetical protein